ncbi:MAG TPA: GspH/FimT family pseudopilin [Casimicrobiaceae bacterium]|jgi:type IV fimbrial biogenesis protein FimT
MRTGRADAWADRCSDGFSLIELLLAFAILGLLVLAAGPSYRDWIAAQQLAIHAHFLAGTLNQARSAAIKSGSRVNLCRTHDGQQCADDASGWEQGWILYIDENGDGEVSAGETIIHAEGPPGNGITVSGNRPVADYVSYTSLGHARMLSGALQMGTFVVCKPGQNALQVVLANSGRARVQATEQRCP